MENETRPTPPDLSEGCHNCGEGKNEILQSRTRVGALCSKCFPLPTAQLSTKPFGARGSN